MSDTPEDNIANLTLMHLRRLDAGQARLDAGQARIIEALLRQDRRLEQIESELNALRRDFRPGMRQVLALMDQTIDAPNRLDEPRLR